jgi:hypothetical protein
MAQVIHAHRIGSIYLRSKEMANDALKYPNSPFKRDTRAPNPSVVKSLLLFSLPLLPSALAAVAFGLAPKVLGWVDHDSDSMRLLGRHQRRLLERSGWGGGRNLLL